MGNGRWASKVPVQRTSGTAFAFYTSPMKHRSRVAGVERRIPRNPAAPIPLAGVRRDPLVPASLLTSLIVAAAFLLALGALKGAGDVIIGLRSAPRPAPLRQSVDSSAASSAATLEEQLPGAVTLRAD